MGELVLICLSVCAINRGIIYYTGGLNHLLYRGVESFTIFTINLSSHGSKKKKISTSYIYEGPRADLSMYVVKIA